MSCPPCSECGGEQVHVCPHCEAVGKTTVLAGGEVREAPSVGSDRLTVRIEHAERPRDKPQRDPELTVRPDLATPPRRK